MFYSQCLLSRKGPLGAIWVAAYSFKKLKKAQVTQTDISSSVDKILQDEWDVVAYRVLAYLLLGVVRIYSKKVEYLFNDCNEVLIKINKFVVSTKKNADADKLRVPYYSVTLPDRFELDAFDLGILEVEDVSGCNVVSHEDITLKDCAKGNGIGQFYSEMYGYEEFGVCDNISSADFTPIKDVLSSYMLDFDMEFRTSSNGANSEAFMEKLQENRFSQEECADLETFWEVQEEPPNQVVSYGEDQETNREQIKAPDIAPSEDGIQGESSMEKPRDLTLSQEGLNLETVYGTEREPSYYVRSSSEDHQIDREEIMEPELVQPENQTCQVIRQDNNLIASEANMEKLLRCTVSQEEYMDLDMFLGAKQSRELVCSSGEENHIDREPIKLPETSSPKSIEHQIIVQEDPDPLSVEYDGTPAAKFPSALGVTTPKLMVIRTPATKESARISRKRKCVIDDMTVLPNEVIRRSIHDAGELVSKRRKVPQTALAVWKACQIGILTHDFSEPLLPAGVSQELKSLSCKRKLKIIEPAETVGTPEKLDVLESPSVGRSEQIEIAPETPVRCSQSMKSFESPNSPEAHDVDIVRPEPSGRIEEEPCLSREQADPPESLEEVPFLDRDILGPGPSGRIEKEPSLGREQADPSGTVEEVPFLGRDQEHDFNLLNEEIALCEGVNPEVDGWSGRTRVVARYLQRHFPNRKKQGEEEVNLLQVSEGRTKRESARLFYEILVLKTKGYVDVKQDDAYGDILIWKRPIWDQTWGDDMVNRGASKTMYLCA